MYICRECENEINQGTEICPHCGADLTVPVPGAYAPAAKPSVRKILLRWGILLGVLLGAIWSFLWFVVPERQGNPTVQAETRAVEALSEVRAALHDYSASQHGAFPRDLDALGEPVRSAAQFAQSVNYQIQYTPGQVEADGLIHSYVLQGRAGNYGFRNFYTDEGGTVRATGENRAATVQDSPY
jgi:rRNA maturation protein Nop10